MANGVNRRSLFQLAGAAALLRTSVAGAQQTNPPAPVRRPMNFGGHPESFPIPDFRSTVALTHGDQRRKNVYTALKSIDKQMQAKMNGKKYVVIKPNFVNTTNQLAASHADSMRGILDYLSESFKGPVVIAESSAGDTKDGYDNFKYHALTSEYRRQRSSSSTSTTKPSSSASPSSIATCTSSPAASPGRASSPGHRRESPLE